MFKASNCLIMMTMMVAAVAMGAYQFDAKTKLDYDVNVVFDGFLPLLGGNEGVADVKFGVQVNGLEPDDLGLRSSIELTAFELSFNGGKLPMLDVNSAKVYFPKTTVSSTKTGKVLKSDAPDIQLPVRLPGLDIKRFPDITYLPIELDGRALETGMKWEFSRMFGDSPMTYSCEVKEMRNGTIATIAVKVRQSYEVLEDETLEIVPEVKGAFARVKTDLTGEGTVIFDGAKGVAAMVDMANKSVSTVTEIKSGKSTTRKLDSKLTVRLKGFTMPGTVVQAPVKKEEGVVGFMKDLWGRGQDIWSQGVGYLTLARMTLGMFLSQVPGGINLARILGVG